MYNGLTSNLQILSISWLFALRIVDCLCNESARMKLLSTASRLSAILQDRNSNASTNFSLCHETRRHTAQAFQQARSGVEKQRRALGCHSENEGAGDRAARAG